MPRSPTTGNHILDALPALERAAFGARLKRVEVPLHAVLFRQFEPITAVHFPISGVLSLVTRLRDGAAVEVTTVGNEGTTAAPVFLGTGWSANAECVAQVPGHHLAMTAEDFRRECEESETLRRIMSHYLAGLLVQVGQGVACNRLHATRQRAARWLLMTDDRVGGRPFPLTHEFLGYMLGVRRASVTDALGSLKDAGMISTSRGRILVVDRAGLEATSCECYAVMRRAQDILQPAR